MSDPLTNRLPPQNRDAERGVLGAILRDPDTLPGVQQVLRAENFYFDAHQKIYQALCDLAAAGQPIDLVMLHDKLRKNKQLDDAGGVMYLTELWEAVPTGANAEYHAGLVHEAALLRGLIHASNETLSDAYSPTMPAVELVAQAERKLFALSTDAGTGTTYGADHLVRDALDRIDRLSSGEEPPGLTTGYAEIDRLLGGMKSGDFVVIAARPSVGKTAQAVGIATHLTRTGVPVLFVSLEMSRSQIMERVFALRSGVPLRAIQSGRLDSDQVDRVTTAARAFAAEPFHFDSTTPMNAARLSALVRRQVRRNGIKLVVVDYLGLMEPEDASAPRVHQIGALSRGLKQLAGGCAVPVLALCQLNRGPEGRQDGKPKLSDLRDSGEIEQDADIVFLLSRQKGQIASDDIHLIDVEIAKNRNGMTGEVTLSYRRVITRFENCAREC